ncbi:MAG TPA: prepilin-type N-terminal cleavage/methylation domain-containing protein [Myxococcales bacterium]|nr:prepilin-type N-terminal cleavage/methylation domain-containing protein [Myxococcales bacterium]
MNVPSSRRARLVRAGFTLIELMVVVAIIALLAAVVIPSVLSRVQRADNPSPPSQRIAQAPPSAKLAAAKGAPPVLEATDIQVELEPRTVLDGFRAYTEYEAAFHARFTVRNQDEAADAVSLRFPFPPGLLEARDVSLSQVDASGALREATGAAYQIDGIGWTGRIAPGERATFEVRYRARGRDAFVYDVAGEGRSGQLNVSVLSRKASQLIVPAASLQPTEVDAGGIHWRLSHVLATRPVMVDLPAAKSPMGQLILLCQLTALAVMLFGAGFWYLGELWKPGRLREFRFGHFLLLALDYSLFFVVFAVVAYREPPALALAVALALSQPLLVIHLSRVFDARFAVRLGLPLSLFTLGGVVAGVYLEAYRPYVFLAVGMIALAALTLTYRRWASQRQAWRLALQRAAARASREQALVKPAAELAAAVDRAAPVLRRAARWRPAQGEVEEASARLSEVVAAARKPAAPAQIEDDEAHAQWSREASSELAAQIEAVGAATSALTEALAKAEDARRQDQERRAQAAQPHARCVACGAALPAGGKFCGQCGARGYERLPCARCGESLEVPVHLIRHGWAERGVHCRSCGQALMVPAAIAAEPPLPRVRQPSKLGKR